MSSGLILAVLTIVIVIMVMMVPLWKLVKYWAYSEANRQHYTLKVIEDNPEIACDHCETWIIGGSRCTVHFCCEGRFCEQAYEEYFDELETSEIKDLLNN